MLESKHENTAHYSHKQSTTIMAFKVYKGKPKVEYFKKTDTTVKFQNGSLVTLSTAGVMALPGNDSDDKVLGVCLKDIAAGDSVDSVPVAIADEQVLWEVNTDSDNGASATDVGRYCAVDTGDTTNPRATVDVSDSDVAHFSIQQVVSASKVRGYLARTMLRKPATHDLDT